MIISSSEIKLRKKLNHVEYSLSFDEIHDNWCDVEIKKQNLESRNFKILLDDKPLQYRNSNVYAPILADIIELAIAIHTADRVCNQNMKYPAREITISLPVRLPKVLSDELNLETLKDLLFWTTGTDWIFSFTQRSNKPRYTEKIQNLPFPNPKTEVILWSGGLDALAGLYYRSRESPDKEFTLLGTGSNDSMFGKQKCIYNSLPKEIKDRASIFQIPIRLSGIDSINKNYYMRSRGVVFALIGSVVALLQGQNNLFIYENGIGAFNLPYSESSVGLDHSRSVNPITLHKISVFISQLLMKKFEILNPFLFSTKTEMLKYLYEDQQIDLIKKSMSCDKPHRESIVQCGYCSSCILRRLSISNTNFEDSTEYKIMKLKSSKKKKKRYFDSMSYQVQRIKKVLESKSFIESKWEAFSNLFPDLDEVIELKQKRTTVDTIKTKANILRMYEKYINEWEVFYATL